MAYFAKKEGVKTLFDIGTQKEADGEYTLLLEIGRTHCYTALLNRKTAAIDHIRMLSFDELEMESEMNGLLQELNEPAGRSVVICSAFPEALLIPHKYFQNDYTALDQVYGRPSSAYFHDSIEEWQMVNAYALPQAVSRAVQKFFPDAQYLHCYTTAIKFYNGYVADHQLSVHINRQDFRVLLKKDMAIHLAQTYAYQTPLDVIYYLLKICYEFGISQQEVFVILSGLVEKESNLYTELQQYFTHLHFAQQPEIGLPQSTHPHSYFTSIHHLAACVL